MLLGGFFDIDLDLMKKEPGQTQMPLRCDTQGRYRRRILTNNGRTAIIYVFEHGVKLSEGETVLLPEYNCITVINSLEAVNAGFDFYKIKPDLSIDVEDIEKKITPKTRVVFIIHYFGFPQPKETVKALKKLAAEHGLIIVEDLTQALYTVEPGQIGFGEYLVTSQRKWMPITDGGLAVARDDAYFESGDLADAYDESVYRQMMMSVVRSTYREQPGRDMQEYLELEHVANRTRYKDFTPRKMTEESKRIMLNFNHEKSIRARRENYTRLSEKLKGAKGLTVLDKPLDPAGGYVPFGFVILVPDRDRLYHALADEGVITEIQWRLPVQYYTPSESSAYIADHNLVLPCDHRYGPGEMDRIAQTVLKLTERV